MYDLLLFSFLSFPDIYFGLCCWTQGKVRLGSIDTCSRSAKCELERKRRLKMDKSGDKASSGSKHITGKNVLVSMYINVVVQSCQVAETQLFFS